MEHEHCITNDILIKAVQNEYSVQNENDIEILNFDVNLGCNVGDNFGSEVKLVKFSFKISHQMDPQEHSYVVKCLPFDKTRTKMLEEVCQNNTC